MRNHIKLAAVLHWVFTVVFAMVMLWVNQTYRNDLNYWKYFDKCPVCRKSFVFGQSQTLAATLFLPAFYFFFPFTSSYRGMIAELNHSENWEIRASQPTHLERERTFTNKQYWRRYIILVILIIPAIVVAVGYKLLIEKPMRNSSDNVIFQSMLNFFFIGICCLYAAWAMTYLKTIAYFRYKLLSPNDFLDLDMLPIKIPAEDDAVDVPLLDNVSADFNGTAKFKPQ